MYKFILILFFVLLGDTRMCDECMPNIWGYCNETQTNCSSLCGAYRITAYIGGRKLLDYDMSGCCVLPEESVEASVNLGLFKTSFHAQCCNNSHCNLTTPNGRQCYSSDGLTCGKTLACEGNEEYCGTATVDLGRITTTFKGCVSEELCPGSNSFLSQLSGPDVSCCKGDLCNSAVTASAGLQLVVVVLVSLALFP
uniref:UPAR/Ly6 domain-containing protein n=1 Tax=Oryzias latipes TaxID=8090 RepID=A0A3P9IBC2_ORYLA